MEKIYLFWDIADTVIQLGIYLAIVFGLRRIARNIRFLVNELYHIREVLKNKKS